MTKTTIEWTDFSINPIRARNIETGQVGHWCEKVSSGCTNCYSSRLQSRFGLFPFNIANKDKVSVFLDNSKLEEVLKWKKPRKIFWCDMSDLFGEWVPDEWIERCFAIMALTPQHTHQVLTKRPERMLGWFREEVVLSSRHEEVWAWACRQANTLLPGFRWPLPNVWLGVSVEDQATADERIPLLLETPAAIHWISAEPLLGPIDLSRWIGYNPIYEQKSYESLREHSLSGGDGQRIRDRRSGSDLASSEKGMGSVAKKDSSQQMRESASGESDRTAGLLTDSSNVQQSSLSCFGSSTDLFAFQGSDSGRNDDQSQEWDQVRQSSREFGIDDLSRASTSRSACSESREDRSERREECNGKANERRCEDYSSKEISGRVSKRDSEGLSDRFSNSIKNSESSEMGKISWLICGGESGPGARPMHKDWARLLRDQCIFAKVPFFMKQWGEWLPFYDRDEDVDANRLPDMSCPTRRWLNYDGGHGFHGDRVLAIERVGKKAAGRKLDGREWNQYPQEAGAK